MELRPIGVARTPYATPEACPAQPDPEGPRCRIELRPALAAGLEGIAPGEELDVLFWLDGVDRDRLQVVPRPAPERGHQGVFGLRSPHRPNPIAVSRVPVVGVEGTTVIVKGLDAVDGSVVLDLKGAR